MSRIIKVTNDTDTTNSTGEKIMKKIMVLLIILSTLIIVSVLYGTNSLNVGEEAALSLEQSYMAQYPKTIPDIMFEPMAANIHF